MHGERSARVIPRTLAGLTVLGFRYEGMRKSDLQRLVVQLKQDFSRQVGPRDQPVSAANQIARFANVARHVGCNESASPDLLR